MKSARYNSSSTYTRRSSKSSTNSDITNQSNISRSSGYSSTSRKSNRTRRTNDSNKNGTNSAGNNSSLNSSLSNDSDSVSSVETSISKGTQVSSSSKSSKLTKLSNNSKLSNKVIICRGDKEIKSGCESTCPTQRNKVSINKEVQNLQLSKKKGTLKMKSAKDEQVKQIPSRNCLFDGHMLIHGNIFFVNCHNYPTGQINIVNQWGSVIVEPQIRCCCSLPNLCLFNCIYDDNPMSLTILNY
ncbi:uncharacterized protein CMU_022920 [Cryptosporidium muris RN66]|uniref:Uncharacterized protein n=1 Tax=Cryptosporidium muris (strain RN66) TaxID=441375 RepID=B6ABT4_CRYMR|nr:uncharacterized protein CMU_022920 [Cryptosporidium muris RN66]EEA05287.1 hypothetical protein CMU_022920 [Cryptosporidium muris RN66]|eukprot:XP_002139636.1 hypothetical protein [Cryptosporidium muris RN66]